MRRLLIPLLLALGMPAGMAAYTPSILNFSVDSDSYIIDSDASRPGAAYERDLIKVSADLSFAGSGSVTIRCDYQLLDWSGTPVLLKNGSGGTTTTFQGGSFAVGSPLGISIDDAFAPAAALEPDRNYTVRLLVKEQSTPGGFFLTKAQDDTTGQRFIHFTNTSSADAAYNVRSSILAFRWVRRFACDTDPANDRFLAEIDIEIHRYDNYLAATPGEDVVGHRVTYELVDASNPSVTFPLEGNTTGPGYTIAEHEVSGTVEIPAKRVVTRQFNINPDGQLDPVNKTYYVRCNLSHEEIEGDPYIANAASVSGPATILLHYNGTVIAGSESDRITLTSIGNNPFTAGFTHLGTEIETQLTFAGARVEGSTAFTLSSAAPSLLRLQPDGSAHFDDTTAIPVSPPATPDVGTLGNIRFVRSGMTFDLNGLHGDVSVVLPTGIGAYAGDPTEPSNHVLDAVLETGTRDLTQELRPQAAIISIPAPAAGQAWHIREESKPVEIIALNLLWNLNTGEFAPGLPFPGVPRARYVRQMEIDLLNATPLPPEEKKLVSNELVYQHIHPTPTAPTLWTADADGFALLELHLDLNPGSFTAHFPRGAEVSWSATGHIDVVADHIVPATSLLPGATTVSLPYARDCEEACGTIGEATVRLDPSSGAHPFQFTRDGGLAVPGSYILAGSRRDLVMGYIDALSPDTSGNPVYAHDTSIFLNGRFLMAGHHLDGGDFSRGAPDGPGMLLHSGFSSTNPDLPERPGDNSYRDGLGDYPGMNFRVSAESAAPTAVSVLGGEATPAYTLSSRSKYYTRPAGVTGIHEPAANPFTGPVLIHQYEFDFTSFGLSFIDSKVHESITAGSIELPHPSDFTLQFDPLHFDCLGGLTTVGIPGGTFDASLAFWNAAFTGISANFQRAIGADCDPSEANLVIGVRTHASNLTPTLAGSLGFHPDGNLITAADHRLEGIDSRLKLPTTLDLAGPDGESYTFCPTQDAYYENHDHSAEPVGRLSFAGVLDVPFFEDLEVHFQTGTTEGNTTDTLHMMGGWPGDGSITATDFDPDNRSYPASTTLTDYRSLSDPAHRIHARQDWLGVVGFDYPLDWNTTTRSFRASSPVTSDLMVLRTEHELTYLSAEHAELDFGASLDLDMPEINLSNLAVDLTANTGVMTALETAISEEVTGALIDGLDASAGLLNDRMDDFYDRLFEQSVDPVIDSLWSELDAVTSTGSTALAERQALVETYLETGSQSVLQKLYALDGTVGQAGTIVDEVDSALARVQLAIRTVIGRVEVSGGQVVIPNGEITVPEEAVVTAGGILVEGIFADAGGDGYDLAEVLTTALIEELAPDIAASLSTVLSDVAGGLTEKLEDELNAAFSGAAPTLEQSKRVLMDLHNAIQRIRDAGDLYSEISDLVLAQSGNLQIAIEQATLEVNGFLAGIDFEEYTAAEIKAAIREAVRDQFNASPVIAAIQATLKSHIYDLDAAINEALSSAFGEVNLVIAGLLNDALPVDSALAGMLGDVADISACGEIDGFARINGDALRTLRLDASIQLKLPDDFEFRGYFEINQLDSDGDSSCSFAGEGEYAAEVKMGAIDVPVSWTGEDLRFDVGTKFTFDTAAGFRLRGFGGAFEMTGGEIGFESMSVTRLGAAAMFGLDENYLAAEVGLKFDSYELAGGIFFGRTCTVEPLKLVDPDVTKVLGSPPFTGIYAYGEAQIPIVNAGCLFNLSARAGAGVFWFEEGNTYGGKMTVGATGRALCAVGVGGDLTLVGSKSGNDYSFYGKGRIWGEVGICKLCTKFSEQVELTYKNDKWSYDY